MLAVQIAKSLDITCNQIINRSFELDDLSLGGYLLIKCLTEWMWIHSRLKYISALRPLWSVQAPYTASNGLLVCSCIITMATVLKVRGDNTFSFCDRDPETKSHDLWPRSCQYMYPAGSSENIALQVAINIVVNHWMSLEYWRGHLGRFQTSPGHEVIYDGNPHLWWFSCAWDGGAPTLTQVAHGWI